MGSASTTTTPDEQATTPRSSGRRRTWGRIAPLLFLVALLLAEAFSRWLSPAMLPPSSPNRTEVTRKAATLSSGAAPAVIAIGDSTMDAGFDPVRFAQTSTSFRSSFNAALMGARFPAMQAWATEVLHRAKPRLVLQTAYPLPLLSLNARNDEAVLDDLVTANVRSLDDSFGQQLDRSISDYSYLVRYRGSLRSPREVWDAIGRRVNDERAAGVEDRPADFWEKNLADNGQVRAFLDGVSPTSGPEGMATLVGQALEGTTQFEQLDALLAVYAQEDVPVVVVIPPVSLEVLRASGLDVGKWERTIDELRTRLAGGIPTIDLSRAPFPRTEFFDALHLNGAGAAHYTNEVAVKLDELCRQQLPSLRCGG